MIFQSNFFLDQITLLTLSHDLVEMLVVKTSYFLKFLCKMKRMLKMFQAEYSSLYSENKSYQYQK